LATKLIKTVRSLKNLENAWRVIQANGRTSKSDSVRLELEEFAEDSSHNLRSLKSRLGHKSFKFEQAKGVPIPKRDSQGKPTGKFRPIVLAPVESRIVQRAILNVLLEIDDLKPFANTEFSFGGIRGERGTGQARKNRHEVLSAVPAAVQAVLTAIGNGGRFVATADIQAFFTRIPKSTVTGIIATASQDVEFTELFRQAIDVELSNMIALREKVADFPIEDIGVAQGNSLSPLLGNIILADFDRIMNEGDCRCIRYIDDFIILAPSRRAAEARMRQATRLLAAQGMQLSPEKSSKGVQSIDDGFDFLGINFCPGAIRPAQKSQTKFIKSIGEKFDDSIKSMRGAVNGNEMERHQSLIAALKRIDGMIDGWGKHYWFCNDDQIFRNLDKKLMAKVRAYLGEYASIRKQALEKDYAALLGVTELGTLSRKAFVYPKIGRPRADRAVTPKARP
jgi:retron-type reverse transcriptase